MYSSFVPIPIDVKSSFSKNCLDIYCGKLVYVFLLSNFCVQFSVFFFLLHWSLCLYYDNGTLYWLLQLYKKYWKFVIVSPLLLFFYTFVFIILSPLCLHAITRINLTISITFKSAGILIGFALKPCITCNIEDKLTIVLKYGGFGLSLLRHTLY